MRDQYIRTLYELAKNDPRIYALISDNGAIVYDKYKETFPDRLINIGIAEATMISVAAGMASCGKIPFTYTISSFLTMRAYEQIRNDVCLQKMNVKLVGIGCGFVYTYLGPTHHALEDIAIMRALPGMIVLSPCDSKEVDKATRAAARVNGPVYLRLATGQTPDIYDKECDFELGKAVELRSGNDLTLISTGVMVFESLKAADLLEKKGLKTRVINIHTIKPIDQAAILKAARETKGIITIEDHSINGGLGGTVCEVIAQSKQKSAPVMCLGIKDVFEHEYGTLDELKQTFSLDAESLANAAYKLL